MEKILATGGAGRGGITGMTRVMQIVEEESAKEWLRRHNPARIWNSDRLIKMGFQTYKPSHKSRHSLLDSFYTAAFPIADSDMSFALSLSLTKESFQLYAPHFGTISGPLNADTLNRLETFMALVRPQNGVPTSFDQMHDAYTAFHKWVNRQKAA